MASSVETLNTVRSILDRLTPTSFEDMVREGMTLSVKSRRLIWKIAEITHDQALHRPKCTILYGKWAACMIEGGFYDSPDSGAKYQTYILCQCYDAIQKCVTSAERTPPNSYNRETTYYIANCEFIGELYMQGVYTAHIVWSYINDMAIGQNNLKMYCLCTLVKSTGPKLSKLYNLTNIIEHLLLQTVTRDSREKYVPLELMQLIGEINEMHKTGWLHKTVPADVHTESSEDLINTDDANNVDDTAKTNDVENVNVKNVNVDNVNNDNVNVSNVNFENVNVDTVKRDNVDVEDASRPDKASGRKLSKTCIIDKNSDIFHLQGENSKDELPTFLDDNRVVHLEGSTGHLDDEQDVEVKAEEDSFLYEETKRILSKNFGINMSPNILRLQLSHANCVEKIKFNPEDEEAVLLVVSEMLQYDNDAANVNIKELPLPDKMTNSSNFKLFDSPCLLSTIESGTNSVQLVPEDDKAGLLVVSEVLQDDNDAADVSRDELPLPDKMTNSSNFKFSDTLSLQSELELYSYTVQFVPEDDEVVLPEVSVVLQDDEDATNISGDKASRLEIFEVLPDEQDPEILGGPCRPMDGVPQTKHDRRKSVWKRFKYWSVKRLRALVCCCP